MIMCSPKDKDDKFKPTEHLREEREKILKDAADKHNNAMSIIDSIIDLFNGETTIK